MSKLSQPQRRVLECILAEVRRPGDPNTKIERIRVCCQELDEHGFPPADPEPVAVESRPEAAKEGDGSRPEAETEGDEGEEEDDPF